MWVVVIWATGKKTRYNDFYSCSLPAPRVGHSDGGSTRFDSMDDHLVPCHFHYNNLGVATPYRIQVIARDNMKRIILPLFEVDR